MAPPDHERLAGGCARIQTLKLADVISNCSTIAYLAPEFAKAYLPEQRTLVASLDQADPLLLAIARQTLDRAEAVLVATHPSAGSSAIAALPRPGEALQWAPVPVI